MGRRKKSDRKEEYYNCHISLTVSEEVRDWLNKQADEDMTTTSSIVRRAIRDFIKNEEVRASTNAILSGLKIYPTDD